MLRDGRCRCLLRYFTGQRRQGGGRDLERLGMYRAAARMDGARPAGVEVEMSRPKGTREKQ